MPDPPSRPNNWEKAVAVAWCFVLGQTVREATAATGVAEQTIRNWLVSSWWGDAYTEARAKVPAFLEQAALGAIAVNLRVNDGQTARYVADRVVPELAPPALRAQIGGSLDINISREDVADARERVLRAAANKKK